MATEILQVLGKFGGVKSWNDLEDKPFGDIVTEYGDTITWDGTPSDTAIVVAEGLEMFHVSNATPLITDLFGGFMRITNGSGAMDIELTESNLMVFDENAYGDSVYGCYSSEINMPVLAVSLADNITVQYMGVDLHITKKGIYFLYSSAYGIYASKLIKEGYNFTETELKTIDPKYLPNTVYGTSGTVTLTADGWAEGVYTLTVEDLGDKDAIIFTPSIRADKTALEDANVFISSEGQTVTFEAETTPTVDITLKYFIERGC